MNDYNSLAFLNFMNIDSLYFFWPVANTTNSSTLSDFYVNYSKMNDSLLPKSRSKIYNLDSKIVYFNNTLLTGLNPFDVMFEHFSP